MTAAVAAPAGPAARARGRVLPVAPARGAMVIVLVAFGGLHWMAMFRPAEPHRAWLALAVVAGVLVALAGAARLQAGARRAAAVVVAVAAFALALLAGGAADEQLRPDGWGSLLSQLARGIEALPGVNVPYRGIDEATRLALGAGGTVLMLAAALLALWPRSGGRTGFHGTALIALVALYVIPAVVLRLDGEFLRGALLTLLVLAYLRLERLPVQDAPAAGALAAGAAVAALVAAPALDGPEPWWDYERWAVDTAAARAVDFNWDHDYSPLDWPRDGRELLRVKASIPSYWKARDLDIFDGQVWRQDPRSRTEDPSTQLPEDVLALDRWSQEISVTIRNLESDTFVGAGIATGVRGEVSYPLGGGVYAAPDGVAKGDSYEVDVYTPRPAVRQLRAAGTDYEDWLRSYRTVTLPIQDVPENERGTSTQFAPYRVTWPAFGEGGGPEAERLSDSQVPPAQLLTDAGLTRIERLAGELKLDAATPYDYVQAVEEHLRTGFAYSEVPPRASASLDGFLFESHVGFCQQFSGAMALLLRMGGVPARVATGFTSGSFDEKEGEYVVRDFDAHSWVEVWFPGVGWVTRDPTPASAPPRSQPGDGEGALGAGGATPGAPNLGGERLQQLDEGRAAAEDAGGLRAWLLPGLVLAALAVVGGVFAGRRRRRRPPLAQRPLAELERALRRARFDAGRGVTLTGLERTFAGWPGAAGYVRALREQRYSDRVVAPTPAQRRGLRAALARDAGVLRAWWALPPRWR